jgi:KipI family sensor histidine kinase inhibitor
MTVRPFGDRARDVDDWERRGLGEAIPAYASVVVAFDPARMSWADAAAAAKTLAAAPPPAARPIAGRLIEVPTVYDGPDLAETAARSGLSTDELITLHSGRDYRALFLGFMPGLAYCGMLDPRIDAPRLASPRSRVPRGSVAIASGQTIVYPVDSPGGWRLIGRTDVPVFRPERVPAALIGVGDRLRFVPR